MTFSIDLRGEKQAIAKLNSLAHLRAMRPYIKDVCIKLQGLLKVYPPSTSANVPGPYPKKWYIRHHGPAWALKGGGWHSRKTSQTLDKKWSIKMRDGGLTGVIGNNAKYAPFVQDFTRQAWFHQVRGWTTVQHVQDTEQPFVVKFLLMAIEKIVGGAK